MTNEMIALVDRALVKLNMTQTDLGVAFFKGLLMGAKPEDVIAALLFEAGLAEEAIQLEETIDD